MANINGWGRGTWSEGAWNEAVPVRVGHTLNGWGEEGFGVTAWGGEKSTIGAMQGQVGTAVVREDQVLVLLRYKVTIVLILQE